MSTAQMLKMEGRQEGRQEARVEVILKVAQNLEGTMPLEEIARVVELPVEELRRLLDVDAVAEEVRAGYSRKQ